VVTPGRRSGSGWLLGWFWGWFWEADRFSRRISRYRGKVSATAGDFLPDEK
jgi:hypothetical protein